MRRSNTAVFIFVCGLICGYVAGLNHASPWIPALAGGLGGSLASAAYILGRDKQ